jgi:hypothetical protein
VRGGGAVGGRRLLPIVSGDLSGTPQPEGGAAHRAAGNFSIRGVQAAEGSARLRLHNAGAGGAGGDCQRSRFEQDRARGRPRRQPGEGVEARRRTRGRDPVR